MMDFIMVPLVTGIVFAGIYGLFELIVRRKERLAIIEKLGDRPFAAVPEIKLGLPQFSSTRFSFSALKIGCLLAGIGLGLLFAFFVSVNMNLDMNQRFDRKFVSALYGASVLLFGGIGLIIAFVIEMKLSKGKNDHSDAG